MNYKTIVVGSLQTNCYLAYCTKTLEAAVIDPGAEPELIIKIITESKIKPVAIINTHGHIDHIGANKDIKKTYNIPLYIHEGDKKMLSLGLQSLLAPILRAKQSPAPDGFLEDGKSIQIGDSSLTIIHTPGHSPGGICLQSNSFLLTGDTLFNMGVGRTDLPGGSWEKLEISIKTKLFPLDEKLSVLPGHGPSSTIGHEKQSNPYIR